MGFYTRKRLDSMMESTFNAGAWLERAEIIQYLRERKNDLLQCGKNDSCNDIALFIDSIYEDLLEKQKDDFERWDLEHGTV